MLVLLVFGVGCGDGFAVEPYPVDVTQQEMAGAEDLIDHLEPVERPVPEAYYIAQFIESPSFNKGNYFAVYRTDDEKYKLRVTDIPADTRPSKAPKFETELEIPESMAKIIYEIWINALLEVRYYRQGYRGLDGTNYTFSSFVRGAGWRHGSIWSPSADLPPKWLVDSAYGIIEFARDPKRDAKKTEAWLVEKRDKLLTYLRKHGKH